MKSITINKVVVRRNSDGLYSLNDVHRSSGGLNKSAVWRFTRLDEFKRDVKFLSTRWLCDNSRVRHTHHIWCINKNKHLPESGTWACKELVYSYAMWVSAEFKFAVINAFDALANNELEKAVSIAKTVTKLEMINIHKELIFHDESKSAMDKLNGITANEYEYKSTASDAGSALSKCRGQKADYADKKQTLQNELQLTLSI